MTDVSISVALCTYNGERFLAQQLDSIARQTRLPDELMVCDDCSSDRTVAIANDFARHAPFEVRVVEQTHNVGPWKNFERAVAACAGEIIFLCDQDDVWREDKIERMATILLTHPQAGGVFSDAEVADADLAPRAYSVWDACGLTPAMQSRFRNGDAFAALLDCHTIQASSLAFRAAHRAMMLPFPPTWQHDPWISIIIAACSDIVPIDEKLMKYRQHESNAVGAPPPKPRSRFGEAYAKLGDLRGYYRTKRDGLRHMLDQLQDLQTRIVSQRDPERFARALAALARRREKLERKHRQASLWLKLMGERAPKVRHDP
jgi:glycosyltransferase involved in cell wall biosynthesis